MIPEKFTRRVHPALMEMAQADLVESGFATQEQRVRWLKDMVDHARDVVTGGEQGQRHLDWFTREFLAHSEILRARREDG